jgi:tetratricopeptide (TPR) repeat protein
VGRRVAGSPRQTRSIACELSGKPCHRQAAGRRDRRNAQRQSPLSASYERVGDILAAQGKFDFALASFPASLQIRKGLAATDGSNAEWQCDVVVVDYKLAAIYQRAGKAGEALAEPSKRRAISARLVAAAPNHPLFKRDLAMIDAWITRVSGAAQDANVTPQ